MKIYTVTEHFFSSVRELFSKHTVEVLPKDYRGIQADLVIFTGGDDIEPARYGATNPPRGWFNIERDERELTVFHDIITGKFSPIKVLGICRGLQLINVGMAGTLVYDIPTEFNRSHPLYHPIEWVVDTSLSSIFPVVNSLHHQGISYIGNKYPSTILAIENKTRIIEAIIWKDKYLAVQFHPEMMPKEIGDKFADFMTEWVAGRKEVTSYVEPVKSKEIRFHLEPTEHLWGSTPEES